MKQLRGNILCSSHKGVGSIYQTKLGRSRVEREERIEEEQGGEEGREREGSTAESYYATMS